MTDENTENTHDVHETIVEVPLTQDEVKTDNTGSGKNKKTKASFGIKTIIAIALACSLLGGAVGTGISLTVKNNKAVVYNNTNTLSSTAATTNVTTFDNIFNISSGQSTQSFLTDIAKNVSPSIVGVRATPAQSSNPYSSIFGGSSSSTSEGSGIILTADGYIVTNSHVIEAAMNSSGKLDPNAKIEIFMAGKLDAPYTAEVIGWDKTTDLAVLKIALTGLTPITFTDSDKVVVGDFAIAIGNPGGLEFMGSVTFGVISGLNRTVQAEDGRTLTYIQTDAAINPGNSGGALLNSKGELVGINTIKIAATGYEGLGFAIPSNTVKEISGSLITYKYVPGRPYLGISAETQYTSQYAQMSNLPEGVYVSSVAPLSGAYQAGIKPNDIITKFNGVAVTSFTDLKTEIAKTKVGDTVPVELYRYSEKKTIQVQVTLSEDKGS